MSRRAAQKNKEMCPYSKYQYWCPDHEQYCVRDQGKGACKVKSFMSEIQNLEAYTKPRYRKSKVSGVDYNAEDFIGEEDQHEAVITTQEYDDVLNMMNDQASDAEYAIDQETERKIRLLSLQREQRMLEQEEESARRKREMAMAALETTGNIISGTASWGWWGAKGLAKGLWGATKGAYSVGKKVYEWNEQRVAENEKLEEEERMRLEEEAEQLRLEQERQEEEIRAQALERKNKLREAFASGKRKWIKAVEETYDAPEAQELEIVEIDQPNAQKAEYHKTDERKKAREFEVDNIEVSEEYPQWIEEPSPPSKYTAETKWSIPSRKDRAKVVKAGDEMYEPSVLDEMEAEWEERSLKGGSRKGSFRRNRKTRKHHRK